MQLQAVVTLHELRALLDQLAPVRIHLGSQVDPEGSPERYIELEDPKDATLVPDLGLRIVCAGHVRYDVGPIHAKLTIREAVVLLSPRIEKHEDGTSALALVMEIERADLAMVPDGIDALIISGVNEILAPKATHVSWSFEKQMRARLPFPTALVPLDAFHIGAQWGAIHIDAQQVRFEMALAAEVTRSAQGLPDLAQDAAMRAADIAKGPERAATGPAA